ncbi:MAG: hypothetical protein IH940_08225 [Acidobacteria bacterium]|nr:hypothetical protein [Acidobacteriota bacterium]
MSDDKTNAAGQKRLDEFAEEVKDLNVSGGLANPERTGSIVGIVLMVIGTIATVFYSIVKQGDLSASGTDDQLHELIQATNNTWFAIWGLALIVIGAALWIRNSLTRYLRYWLIRMIYEDRANTDRLIEALRDRD